MRRNPQMEFTCEFFERPLKEYRDWNVKWWREVIQNSVDAGATRVDLGAIEQSDGSWLVSCLDNGSGMTWDVFQNVFLKIGPTSKKNPRNPIGGFGKARELIILPWLHWRVVSGGFEVQGQGAHYEDPVAVGDTVGTLVEVLMPADHHTSHVEALEFLGNCELSGVKFYVNGDQFTDKLRATKPVVDWDFGTLYQNKAQRRYKCIVRVNGLYMFSTGYTPEGMGAFILELQTPPRATSVNDVLTATRDDFRDYTYRNTVDGFLQELGSEREQALKQRSGIMTKVWKGDSRFKVEIVERRSNIIEQAIERSGGDAQVVLDAIEEAYNQPSDMDLPIHSLPSQEMVTEIINSGFSGCSELRAVVQQLSWTPDFIITQEIEGYHVPKKFFPLTMGQQVKALALVWAKACQWVFIQLKSEAEYGVGFIFSEDEYGGGTLAQFRHDENGNWLLLNPLVAGIKSEKIFSKSNREHMQEIYARAIHECTHMSNGFMKHDSAFAAAITHNFALCADGFPAFMRMVREIKLEERPEAEEKPKREKAEKSQTGNVTRFDGTWLSDGRWVVNFYQDNAKREFKTAVREIYGSEPASYYHTMGLHPESARLFSEMVTPVGGDHFQTRFGLSNIVLGAANQYLLGAVEIEIHPTPATIWCQVNRQIDTRSEEVLLMNNLLLDLIGSEALSATVSVDEFDDMLARAFGAEWAGVSQSIHKEDGYETAIVVPAYDYFRMLPYSSKVNEWLVH